MKQLLIILFLLITKVTFAQTTFTQTFVDRCTGEVNVVTANFVNNSATVAFYNRIRTFTYQQFLNGELQQWLSETYVWWNTLSPCETATQQAQQAQQTAQTATAAASAASSAASTATSATQSTGGTTNATTTNNSTESNSTNSSNTSESTSSEGGSSSDGGESGGGEETSSEGSESESEGSETESEGEESSEDSEGGEDEGEDSDDREDSDDGEESEEEDVKKKKKTELLPIQLRADMMVNQALLGNYDAVMSVGVTQSSIFGDVTYGATAMIYSNLKQIAINGSYTKVNLQRFNVSQLIHQDHSHYAKGNKVTSKDPITIPVVKVSSITSASVGYMNNFGNGTIVTSINKLKPMEKWGTAGVGVMLTNSFGEGSYQSTSLGYNILYTNMVMVTPKIQYAPAIIWTQTPYVSKVEWKEDRWGKSDLYIANQLDNQRIHGMIILANSFTIQLTRRFSFNVGTTFIKSTDPLIPLIKSFSIGSKLPF